MFSTDITESDRFVEMPASTQNLYFHLGMHGDDDGFVSAPQRITRSVGSDETDLERLANEGFIIPFPSGVIVVTHWLINNTLRNDRYKPTIYADEKAQLSQNEAKKYTLGNQASTVGIPNDNQLSTVGMRNITELNSTQHNITEQNEGMADKPPHNRFFPPSVDEVREYCKERGNSVDPVRFVDYYTANGWMVGKSKMKDWKAAVRTWENNQFDNGRGDTKSGSNNGVNGDGWNLQKEINL